MNHPCTAEQAELPETLSELARMAEETGDSVVLADPEGLICWMNEPFLAMCGYSREELLGQKPGRLLQGPGSDPAVVGLLHEAMQKREPCECFLLNYRKDGRAYPVQLSIGPVHDDHGRLAGFLAVERDLG